MPFQCVATDVVGVREVWFRSGPADRADPRLGRAPGGVPAGRDRRGPLPRRRASSTTCRWAGRSSWGPARCTCCRSSAFARPRPEPRRPLDVAVQSYWIARHHRFKRELAAVPPDVDVHLLPDGADARRCATTTSPASAELMSLAYEASSDYLAGRPQAACPRGPSTQRHRRRADPGDGAAAVRGSWRRPPEWAPMSDSPVHLTASGPPETILDDEPAEAQSRPRRRPGPAGRPSSGTRWPRWWPAGPASSTRWAQLGQLGRDDVEGYAYHRVGYHRGLDRLRASGWRGSGYVRWRHPPEPWLPPGARRAAGRRPRRSASATRPSAAPSSCASSTPTGRPPGLTGRRYGRAACARTTDTTPDTTTAGRRRPPRPGRRSRARRSIRSPWPRSTRSTITTLVDNSYDGLMADVGPARRRPWAARRRCRRPTSRAARPCRGWSPSTASPPW